MKMLTLDSVGFETDPPKIIDRTLRNFFVANYSQTNIHWGEIKSLPYLIAKNAQNYYALQDEIATAIKMLLTGAFDHVEANISIAPDPTTESSIGQIITVDVSVQTKGRVYSMGKLLSVVNNRISKIQNSN